MTLAELLKNYRPEPKSRKKRIINGDLRILRVYCQRPYFTGSGVYLINLIEQTELKNIKQFVIFGLPADADPPFEDVIPKDRYLCVYFKPEYDKSIYSAPDLDFYIAGMSDEMPYKSTKFSDFNKNMLESYLNAFANKIKEAIQKFKPNIIHAHHLWLTTALSRVLCPDLPMIATCHNTGLRQMILAKNLRKYIIKPIKDIDIIAVQNEHQINVIKKQYDINSNDSKFKIVEQGFNSKLFNISFCDGNINHIVKNFDKNKYNIVYVGKLCFSKGVPQLLEAFKDISFEFNGKCKLYLVGAGTGAEKEEIERFVNKNKNNVEILGQLSQSDLAILLKNCDLFVLPSFYDGFPKVLLESLACGCKVIVTDLPGLKDKLNIICKSDEFIQYIPLPKMKEIDKPKKEELPQFIAILRDKLRYNIKKKIFIEKNQNPKIKNISNKICEKYGSRALFNKYLHLYMEFKQIT
ncbi:MAG: glycosyltransferase family 4 protein [Promethearchaeota archaeon]